ncbi:alanine-glyoxylate transaminase / serine-glyoxylate transaminase / serine-pyruvate transaminase [Desulfocicer vacuolatum DSM 3385]|uniref:Alanine-glyoxylate transaminase / serine-glyoxylate transaminase / serine-pyruvate transaminase n=1 Tax=Desulfocicer vacuolatum DSM 3385 TaxID=1121400 RepID=A0A1W2AGI3_9BACT|nr:alanine--glyoxylate aminotransferase family protein [Desulfocicer vacuolatum]SMC59807.1 alanine-glyoxylate transaminase / serine-glyoxylate transaminase / serine-pyruvate transaminase [Desulfocicer vacuolatum DSM 3385]
MENLLNGIEEITLMGPGPSCVNKAVLDAMAKSTLGHLDPKFINIMDAIKEQMKTLLHTNNKLTIPVSGTGSAGMETCFVNLIEKDDPVLILINGVFGMRMQDVATRLGADVDTIEFEWGTPVVVDEVKAKLSEKKYKIVAVVHAETSTGVKNPVPEIGALVKDTDALYLVDAVTSLGGIPIRLDDWNIDVFYSGTQKCLSCPPGLAPISFSEKAVEAIKKRKTKVPNWYLDLTMIINYWEGATRAYHHTAPINMLYALYQALYLILEEGEENVHKRHMNNHLRLVNGLDKIGIKMLVDSQYRLPMLNSVYIPQGADDAGVRSALLKDHKIEIGAGLGPLAGKIWRIGLMGHTARSENVDKLLTALKSLI